MILDKPLVKVPLRYGLIGGVIASAMVATLYFMGKHPLLLPVIFDFRILLFAVFIFFSLKEVRDYYFQGILFFWQGMIGSYVFLLVSGVMGSVFVWGMATWSKGFLPGYIEKLVQQLSERKAEFVKAVSQEVYDQQMAKLPSTTAWDLASDYFLKSMIIGLFLTVIISVVIRQTPKNQ